MIVKPIDLAMVQQLNEVSHIKQNQDQRPAVEQQMISTQVEKTIEEKSEMVVRKEDIEKEQRKYDAKDKNDNEYDEAGHKQEKKKKISDGKVFLKGHNFSDFDIKI